MNRRFKWYDFLMWAVAAGLVIWAGYNGIKLGIRCNQCRSIMAAESPGIPEQSRGSPCKKFLIFNCCKKCGLGCDCNDIKKDRILRHGDRSEVIYHLEGGFLCKSNQPSNVPNAALSPF